MFPPLLSRGLFFKSLTFFYRKKGFIGIKGFSDDLIFLGLSFFVVGFFFSLEMLSFA